ncbi:MAG: hypothetical protein CSYNP_01621 [Syntrophus sp. SKADARSKE-3]|nr:hypothetical protein [Syntrophus sp. SKADARSKE-3]
MDLNLKQLKEEALSELNEEIRDSKIRMLKRFYKDRILQISENNRQIADLQAKNEAIKKEIDEAEFTGCDEIVL